LAVASLASAPSVAYTFLASPESVASKKYTTALRYARCVRCVGWKIYAQDIIIAHISLHDRHYNSAARARVSDISYQSIFVRCMAMLKDYMNGLFLTFHEIMRRVPIIEDVVVFCHVMRSHYVHNSYRRRNSQ